MKLGQTLSGLLNASFGNAVEIIVGIAALLQGELALFLLYRCLDRVLFFRSIADCADIGNHFRRQHICDFNCSLDARIYSFQSPARPWLLFLRRSVLWQFWNPSNWLYYLHSRWPQIHRKHFSRHCGSSVSILPCSTLFQILTHGTTDRVRWVYASQS